MEKIKDSVSVFACSTCQSNFFLFPHQTTRKRGESWWQKFESGEPSYNTQRNLGIQAATLLKAPIIVAACVPRFLIPFFAGFGVEIQRTLPNFPKLAVAFHSHTFQSSWQLVVLRFMEQEPK